MKNLNFIISLLLSVFIGSAISFAGAPEIGFAFGAASFSASFFYSVPGMAIGGFRPKGGFVQNALKSAMPGAITPQGKLIGAADAFGNKGLKYQQGSSRKIYDTLPLDGRQEYVFFEGANNRDFPLTNLNQSGGKLGVGEGLVMQRMYLMFCTIDPVTGAFTGIGPIDTEPDFVASELNFIQANQVIIERMPMSSASPEFNENAAYNENSVLHFDTLLTIQPELPFKAVLRLPAGVTGVNGYVRMVIEGAGAIIAPKQNF